jgi:predicted transcriptional regulator
LIIPCEVATRSVIPAVKALIARELVERHNLKQDKVAEILGISQSAVSKYTRKVRGYVIEIENIEAVQPLITDMIALLTNKSYPRAKFLRLFCLTCSIIRRRSLMCEFCRKSEATINVEECKFCVTKKSQPE